MLPRIDPLRAGEPFRGGHTGFLSDLLHGRRTKTQRTAIDQPLRIPNPTVGFLNLQGMSGAALADSDRRALSPLFKRSQDSIDAVPKCDVLFIYCALDAGGKVVGPPVAIRDFIKRASAYVAIVASGNTPDSYIKAMASRNDWHANIVLVIDRKGDNFARFFTRLFEAMLNGRSMLMAWVDLAPQVPGRDHPDSLDSIFAAEAGHITFDG